MGYLKVGAMANACNTTVRALHLYQECGILQPEVVDPESGYRGYSIMQSAKLDMINQLQSAGLSLREISEIAAAKDAEILLEHLTANAERIDAEIARLELAKKITDDLMKGCDRYLHKAPCNRPILESIPSRRILLFDAPTDADLGGSGYTDNERWEWYQQYTKRRIIEGGFPLSLFRRVGCYVPADQVGPAMDLLHARPFVFVDETFGPCCEQGVELPGGPYLSVYYDACHADDGSDLDDVRIPTFLAAVAEGGYEVDGPFVVENIFRFMRFFNEDAHSYYCHRLRVRPAGR